MKRETVGKIVFLGATGLALALYALTAPDGLPWNASSHFALAYLGEVVRLPAMPHRIWGFYVQVFGGSVALAATLASVAAGLLGAIVNRYVGWRFAAAAAILWIFLPSVWNRAITGERSVVLVSMAVVALWTLNAIGLLVTKKARAWRAAWRKTSGGLIEAALPAEAAGGKRRKASRIAGWIAFGAAGVFALFSAKFHDYRLGEAASAFARGVVESAQGRIIVMNGLCDDQVVDANFRSRQKEDESSSDGRDQKIASTGNDIHCSTSNLQPSTFNFHCSTSNLQPPTSNFHCSTSNLQPSTSTHRAISLRNDDAYRANLLGWVRRAFPGETNLWVAAEVSPSAFVTVAAKAHPERFYLMNGTSTTFAEWERRWKAFQPYLDSSDPFVPTARRMFAREGNEVGNALAGAKSDRAPVDAKSVRVPVDANFCSRQDEDESSSDGRDQKIASTGNDIHCSTSNLQPPTSSARLAWLMYKLLYEEVDPGNISALVNMNEMIRNGYPASGSEKLLIEKRLAHFFENRDQRRRVREIVRAAGPVRVDPARLAKMADEARSRIAARVAAGEPIKPSPEAMTLAEWHNEMIVLMNRGETEKAGRLARLILSEPKWRGHIPANAVMGGAMARAGDYVASESFYRTATATTNRIPARVLNGYADTLLHRGKLDEAEKMARRAVAETDETFWMARLTLAEILFEKTMAGDPRASRGCISAKCTDGGQNTPSSGGCISPKCTAEGQMFIPSPAHFGEMRPRGDRAHFGEMRPLEIRSLLSTVPATAPKALRDRVDQIRREIGR